MSEQTYVAEVETADQTDPEDAAAVRFCDARQTHERGALVCDYLVDHDGARHCERWVATWRRDGSDVRWYVGDSLRTGRPVYRTAPAPPVTDTEAGRDA